MLSRIQFAATVKPGRMADAIGQFQEVNAIVQRLAGVTGQLFNVAYGERCLGGVVMTWDYPSGEALAAFEAASATDTAWTELVTRVVAADSPWVLPAPRELLRQVV